MKLLFSCLLVALLASPSLAAVETELGMPSERDMLNWLQNFLEILHTHVDDVKRITNDTGLSVDWYEQILLGKPLVSDMPSDLGHSSIVACMVEILRESLVSWLGTKQLIEAKVNEAVALVDEIVQNMLDLPKLFEAFQKVITFFKSLVVLPREILGVVAKYSKSVLENLLGCTTDPTTKKPTSEKPSTLEPTTQKPSSLEPTTQKPTAPAKSTLEFTTPKTLPRIFKESVKKMLKLN